MNPRECYEILGIPNDYDQDDFNDVVLDAFIKKNRALQAKLNRKEISDQEYIHLLGQLTEAKKTLISLRKSKTTTTEERVIATDDREMGPLVGGGIGSLDDEDRALETDGGEYHDLGDFLGQDDYDDIDDSLGQDDYETGAVSRPKTKSAGGNAFKKVLATAGCVVVIGGSIALGWFLHNAFDKKADLNNVVGVEAVIEETQNPNYSTEAPTETTIPAETATPTEETKEVEEAKPMVMNYGDISDTDLVQQRATNVVNQLSQAGVINMNTGLPYTVDEIIKVNQFICGAYVPEVEAEAYSMVNDYLNFCIMDSDLTIAFANVNGIDWNSIEDQELLNALKNTDLPNLQRLQETTPKIMIVDNMLYGDVSVAAYNYLKMFESKYQEMIYSTDQKLCDDIYLDLTYSLTRLRVNGEYTFTWNNEQYTVTMNDFSGKDKINAGNILQYYVFMYQTAFSKIEEAKMNELGNSVYNGIDDPSGDKYTYTYVPGEVHGETVEDSEHLIGYHDENISLDDSVNYADHKYLETTEYFNAACYQSISLEDIALDDDGYIFLIGNQEGENFSTMNQVNSINAALANFYAKGLDYYNQTFNKTLKK